MAKGYCEETYESIPGNESNSPTLSTKKLFAPVISLGVALGPEPMDRDDENINTDEPRPSLEDAHDPSWSTESRMYPDVLGFRLKGILGAPVTTAGDGVITDPDSVAIPVGATRHVWTAPFGPSGPSPLTTQKTVSYADQSVYFRAKGCATDELTIETPEKGGARVKAKGPALYLTRLVSDPSLTPAYEGATIHPFKRGGLTLSWLAGSATSEDFDLMCVNPCEPLRSMGIASKFPDAMEYGDALRMWRGSISKRSIDPDDYDALKAATTFAATAKWISDTIITGTYPYKLFVVMTACQYVGGEMDALANQRRHKASFDWKAVNAGSTSVTVTLVNATTSYA